MESSWGTSLQHWEGFGPETPHLLRERLGWPRIATQDFRMKNICIKFETGLSHGTYASKMSSPYRCPPSIHPDATEGRSHIWDSMYNTRAFGLRPYIDILNRALLNEVLLTLASYLGHPSVFDKLKNHIVLFKPEVYILQLASHLLTWPPIS